MTYLKSNRSGGPRTADGKASASQNALKLGGYASTLILPGENEAQLEELQDQFLKDFAPQDIAELTMVRDLTQLAWKLQRVDNALHTILFDRLSKPATLYEYEHLTVFSCTEEQYQWIQFVDIEAVDQLLDDWTMQMDAVQELADDPTPKKLSKLKSKLPERFEAICEEFELSYEVEVSVEAELLTAQLKDGEGQPITFLQMFRDGMESYHSMLSWVYRKK